MIAREPGSYETYRDYLREAKDTKAIRNVMSLGFVAATAAVNFAKLTPTEHVGATGIGLAFAAASYWGLERHRREAIHDAHIEAAIATNHSRANDEPVPRWAEGNTGNILEPRT